MSGIRIRGPVSSLWSVFVCVLAAAQGLGAVPQATQESQAAPREAPAAAFEDVRVIGGVGRYGRSPVFTDAVLAEWVAGRWTRPVDGATVELADGSTRAWQRVEAGEGGEDGELRHAAQAGGYLYATVRSEGERVLLLEAAGHTLVYVNGEPRVGDPYRTGYVVVPVLLRAGENEFLFAFGRGELHAKLREPVAAAQLNTLDATLPDAVAGAPLDAWGAVVVMNGSAEPLLDGRIDVHVGGMLSSTALPPIPPLGIRKVPLRIRGEAVDDPGEGTLRLTLLRASVVSHTATLPIRVRRPQESRKCTYVSEIDGSVQYYALQPAARGEDAEGARRPGLVLTLHGASVEATSQADAYAAKDWVHIVAATNRRPYGFDWEDWGRVDALEALAAARNALRPDPQRIYLTGHSMGGHGTWHVGVTYPDAFAAIAPSAGWISFWSYTGAERFDGSDAVLALLARATNPSDTLALSRNFLQHGVYILHGEDDDNVPAEQSRQMRRHLAEFHRDFEYHEQPGAGHWWGNECVDWPPLFEFLRGRTRPLPAAVEHVEFVTASPGVSATCHWVTIEAQERCLDFSRVDLRVDSPGRRIAGTVENVARLGLWVGEGGYLQEGDAAGRGAALASGAPLSVELNGTVIDDVPWPDSGVVRLGRTADGWEVLPPRPLLWRGIDYGPEGGRPASRAVLPGPYFGKGPHRYGPFKEVFGNRVQLVYGTRGTAEENAWALAKARYDAEVFWYRGNGSLDVIPDTRFRPDADPGRNVVLYGNWESNSAWEALLGDAAVRVARGGASVATGHAERRAEWEGANVAVLAIAPRPGSDVALVGVVGGTGLPGMRLTDRLPYFVSGVGYPDWIVLDVSMLREGAAGVQAAGFFNERWEPDAGQSAWRKAP